MFFQVTIALEISLPDIEIFDYTAFKTICQEMIASLPLAVQRKITDREQKQRAQKTMIDLKKDAQFLDRKSTRLNSSHSRKSRMPSSA